MATLNDSTALNQKSASSPWLLPVIVLVALAIRLVVAYFTYPGLPDADKNYEQFGWEIGWVARALADGRGFSSPFFPWSGPTAMVPPLYPYLLAGVFKLFGVYSLTSGFIILALNSLFSALTCIPVYFSAKYSLGRRGAKIAAIAWAIYPFAIYFSAGRVWEYALTALLFTTCFCIAQRIHRASSPLLWLGFGLLYGLTALSNPSVLSMLPFLLVLALWKVRRAGGRWLLLGACTALGVLAAITPWTVRNYRDLGILCPIRDNYWLEFQAGNFGDTSDPNPPSAHPASSDVEMQKFLAMGEPAYMAQEHAKAIDYVSHHRLAFIGLSLRRVLYYWSGFWSFSPEYMSREPFELPNMFFCGGITLLMLRGIFRLWRLNRAAALPYLVLIAIFPLTYYISHPLMDYRQPIEPAILVLVIAGIFPFRFGRMKLSKAPGSALAFPHEWIGAERARVAEPE